MKKLINKGIMMLMLMAVMSLGFASCSNDEDEPSDGGNIKGGKMTGWVKIDGKKTDFKFCYGMQQANAYGHELGLTAWSKDIYKIKPNDKVSFADITVAYDKDGNIDKESGRVALSFEIYIDGKMTNDGVDGGTVYVDESDGNGITSFKDGDKFVIDGRNVKVSWGEAHGESNLNDLPNTTTIDFHFEGTPQWLNEDDFED